jgi:hypothetical protein
MKLDRKAVVRNLALVIGTLVLIPVVALGALAVSARERKREVTRSLI